MFLAIVLMLTNIEATTGTQVCSVLKSDSSILGGVQAVLLYDSSLLKFESLEVTKGVNSLNAEKPGKLVFAVSNVNPALPAEIAKICFSPLRPGTGELKLTEVVAGDGSGKRLELTIKNASVEVDR